MKKISILVTLLVLCAVTLFAQAPEKFSYQAVVRNASNALVPNAPVGVRVSILQGSASGNAVYVETHTASTNANGLLTVEIGGGTVQQGSFAGINWANGPFFLKTETDPAGGTNYTVTSTQQLMSVPYALYAEEAGNGFSGDYNDLTNKPTIPQNVGDLTNDAGYITQNDLPDIPTVPTNVSSFINDAGYVTLDSIPTQVNADWNATEGVAEILNKPVNANFGHGIVFTKVNNAVGATDLTVGFTNYTLMTGGVVSLSFTNDVPAGATLNINNQGAKAIHYRGVALTDGVIKANDRCLFMYNATVGRYYLLANDRWGVDVDALAAVAYTGSYNDLTDKPEIPDITGLQQQLDSLQDVLATAAFTCGTSKVRDIDGNEYNTLKIGSQCWMKENVRTTHYADGTLIPLGTDSSSVVAYRYAPMGNESNVAQYGYLYNWSAMMNGADYSDAIPSGVQGVCPTGWHVPSDGERDLMVETLSSNSDYSCGGYSDYIAKAVASNVGWSGIMGCPNNCLPCYDLETNNASGFSAMPAGAYTGFSDADLPPEASDYFSNGYFIMGVLAAIWSSSYDPIDDGPQAMGVTTHDSYRLDQMVFDKEQAISVRCVRDVYEGYVPTINLHDSLAEVAFTGDYNSLENRPPIPTVNNATLTIQQNGANVGTFTANQSSNQTVNITSLTAEQVQAMITTAVNDAVGAMQQQVDNLQDKYDSLQDKYDSVQDQLDFLMDFHTATCKVPSSGSTTVNLDNVVAHVDVYDWGGPDGYYGNSWDGSLTLVANSSDKVFRITGHYNTEDIRYDTILIYNGSGIVGANTIVKLGGTGTISEPIYSSGNTITIRFGSDGSYCNYEGFALGIDVVDKPSCTAAKAVDRQGHYYNTVQIGNQCWMKENLRTTKYADGASIPSGGSTTSSTSPYYYDYSIHSLPVETRGLLYNWPAAMHGAASSSANPSGVQGICPSGWHLPSDAEWTQLTDYVNIQGQYACGGDDTYIAKALASTSGWNSSTSTCAVGNNQAANNATGFSAVPAGHCNGSLFYSAGNSTFFWSSSQAGSNYAWSYYLNFGSSLVDRDSYNKYRGYSVRCVKN